MINPLSKLGLPNLSRSKAGLWLIVIVFGVGVLIFWIIALAFVGSDEAGYPEPVATPGSQQTIAPGSVDTTGKATTANATINTQGVLRNDCSGAPAEYAQYAGLINATAQKYNVPPSLIAGIIQQESGFRPAAKSGVGAKGLMQLMPDTARELGLQVPRPPDYQGPDDRLDPQKNVDAGTRYIKKMLDSNHGDVPLALASYNAGLGNVQKYGGIPPFAETQNYVTRVTAFSQKYAACLSGGTQVAANAPVGNPSLTVTSNTLAQAQQANLFDNHLASVLQSDSGCSNPNRLFLYLQTHTSGDQQQALQSCNGDTPAVLENLGLNYQVTPSSDYDKTSVGLTPGQAGVLPNQTMLNKMKARLLAGQTVNLYVAGQNCQGQSIAILGVASDNTLSYFDPSSGQINQAPLDASSSCGGVFVLAPTDQWGSGLEPKES